jgi:hypothetical protein
MDFARHSGRLRAVKVLSLPTAAKIRRKKVEAAKHN